MTSTPRWRHDPTGRPFGSTFLVDVDGGSERDLRVIAYRRRLGDRVLARVRAGSLDAQLAAAHPGPGGRLRATRAEMLVAPEWRAALADYWLALLERAQRPRTIADPRLPLPRARIIAAKGDIVQLVLALRTPQPVSARGVALAHLLLTDGRGPVYRATSRRDLQAEIHEAIDQLDPLLDFAASSWNR